MRALGFAVAAVSVLAGCEGGDLSHANRSFFLKPGVTLDRLERDAVACANQATAAAPNAPQVGWVPYLGVYSFDPNDRLRSANMEICMRDRGYSFQPVPHCPLETRDTVIATGFGRETARSQQMRVNRDACYVNNRGVMLLKA